MASGGYEGKLHFRPSKQKEINIGYILCLNGGSNRDFLLEQFIASAKVLYIQWASLDNGSSFLSFFFLNET